MVLEFGIEDSLFKRTAEATVYNEGGQELNMDSGGNLQVEFPSAQSVVFDSAQDIVITSQDVDIDVAVVDGIVNNYTKLLAQDSLTNNHTSTTGALWDIIDGNSTTFFDFKNSSSGSNSDLILDLGESVTVHNTTLKGEVVISGYTGTAPTSSLSLWYSTDKTSWTQIDSTVSQTGNGTTYANINGIGKTYRYLRIRANSGTGLTSGDVKINNLFLGSKS